METAEFLRATVTGGAGNFVLAYRNHVQPWQQEWYLWPNDLQTIIERSASMAPTHDVYFTSYLFSDRTATRVAALPTSTIQADLDHAEVSNLPIAPSILVETSPQHYHAYWLLKQQLEKQEHERLSKRMTYAIRDADRTGWAIGHRLRMANTKNHKYTNQVYDVRVLSAPLHRYAAEDIDLLPDMPPEAVGIDDETSQQDPFLVAATNHKIDVGVGPLQLIESVRDRIPVSVYVEYQATTPAMNRSAALWSLMCACFTAGLTREQIYWLAWNSPNNKFKQDQRYHAELDLALDVQRAERHTRSKDFDARAMVDVIRVGKSKRFAAHRGIASTVRDVMRVEGEFIKTVAGEVWYLPNNTGRPMEIARHSSSMDALLEIRFGLNPTELEQSYVVENLKTITNALPETALTAVLSYYDITNNVLMLHTGHRDMMRIAPDNITRQRNGSSNVLFTWESVFETFSPDQGANLDWGVDLFGPLDTITNMSVEEARCVLKVWFLFVLFRNAAESRPILALFGVQGSGKGQLETDHVLTPDGWTTFKDVQIGDTIIGSQGTPVHVTGVFPRGEQPTYRITFSDGHSITVDADHLWSVTTHPYRNRHWVFPTKHLATVNLGEHWQIPMVKPVEFAEKDLPIEPYTLGVLLGDGTLNGPDVRFCPGDERVPAEVEKLLPEGHRLATYHSSSRATAYGIVGHSSQLGANTIQQALKQFGLNVKGYYRFIPQEYLFASVAQRLALLQGLMDTDGQTATGVFASSSEKLTDGVAQLVESLGGTVKRRTKAEPKYTYKGDRLIGQPSYEACISMPKGVNPFRAQAAWFKPHTKYFPIRTIKSIEPAGTARTVCISTDAPDQLYVTDNYVVTHNTQLLRRIYRLLYAKRLAVSGLTTAEDYDHSAASIPFYGIDNADSYVAWLPDKLAQSICDIDTLRRKLYTNGEIVRMRKQAMVGVTSHNPRFTSNRPDVADRLLLLNFRRVENDHFMAEGPIYGHIDAHRDQLWGAIISDLQRILQQGLPTQNTQLNMRVQDFAWLGEWIAAGLDAGAQGAGVGGHLEMFRRAVGSTVLSQSSLILQDDEAMITGIATYVANTGGTNGQFITANELYTRVLDQCPENTRAQFQRSVRTSRMFASKLNGMYHILVKLFDLEYENSMVAKTWKISPKPQAQPTAQP